MGLQVRSATLDDMPVLISLADNTSSAAHWSAEQYGSLLKNPLKTILVLESDALLGFLVGARIGDEWELENIVIRDSARQRGFGARLLADFIAMVRRQHGKAVFLEVRESNKAALGLYKGTGFVETGRRRSYYRDPTEDALLFKLALCADVKF